MKKYLLVVLSLFLFSACSTKAEDQHERNQIPLKQLQLCEKIRDDHLRVECITSVGDGLPVHEYP